MGLDDWYGSVVDLLGETQESAQFKMLTTVNNVAELIAILSHCHRVLVMDGNEWND